jgi:hypothetical protein
MAYIRVGNMLSILDNLVKDLKMKIMSNLPIIFTCCKKLH